MKKKLLALCLSVCVSLPCFAACDNTEATETTASEHHGTVKQSFELDGTILKSCVGQADENGVYVVPDSVTMIAEGAFTADTSLKEVVIGSNVKVIGSGAFQYCTSLEKVTIEDGVEQIGSYAFFCCSSLTDVQLPETVTRLENYTFARCDALGEISLDSIQEIGSYAFLYCSVLESVTLSEKLTSIEEWAVAQCTQLNDISFENTPLLESIGDYAFTGCAMLRSISFSEGLRSIGKLVFYDCTRLVNVEIPSTVESVDFAAFNYTPWYQENGEDYLIVGDGVLIRCTVHPSKIDLSDKGIKVIGGTAFWNAENDGESAEYGYKYAGLLESLTIPEGITVIGTSAFTGCYNLKELILPSTVVSVNDSAFYILNNTTGEASETNIDFSKCENLSYIGNYAFYGCSGIETIDLPMSVDFVGEYAFGATSAYLNFIEEAVKAEDEKDRYLLSGDGILVAAYVADGQTAVHIPEGVKMIAGAALCGWDNAYIPTDTTDLSASGISKYNLSYNVKELVLPSTLEVIGNKAFFRMLSVESVVLPESLRLIGMEAFGFCDALTSLSGGANVEEIQTGAFRYCANIKYFTFSENTKVIGSNMFAGCSSLQIVTFPESVSDPGEDMFDEACTALTKITLSPDARPNIYSVLGTLAQEIKIYYYK